MTFLVDRLVELRKYLDHLYGMRERAREVGAIEDDLSLHNDVLFSLLMVAQLVIDMAGEIGAREGIRFEDYTQAVRNLARVAEFPRELLEPLARLPGFRNVLIHEYVELDYDIARRALDELEPVEAFAEAVRAYVIRSEARGSNLA
ncbi:MAG: DUF86 domain-containing protein [Gemmatimonadota bacterium]